MGVLKCEKKIRYRLCERASSRFGSIVRGLPRDKELVGRLQWSLEVSSFPSSSLFRGFAASCLRSHGSLLA